MIKSQNRTIRKLRLCVVVDAEEDFDWSQPLSSKNADVHSAANLKLAQAIFDKHGIVPTYLLTYPIATKDAGRRAIDAILASGNCVIGAQLHPWVTPPYSEIVSARTSYPKNLSPALEDEKIYELKVAIRSSFGVSCHVYKAGRYGLDPSRSETLVKYGFKIDTSVMPNSNFVDQGAGPDFFSLPEEPFWLDKSNKLLAVPSTQSIVGSARHLVAPSVLRRVFGATSTKLHLPSLLARAGLIERIRFSPEGSSLEDMKRLARNRIEDGAALLCLSFHSPSLMPGNTPYVRTDEDLKAFLNRLDEILTYTIKHLGAEPASIDEIYQERLAELSELEADPPQAKAQARCAASGGISQRKILFISGFTPPRAPVGSVRTAHLLKYWRDRGHDVRTIAIDLESPSGPQQPTGQCFYLPYREPGEVVTKALRRLRGIFAVAGNSGDDSSEISVAAPRAPSEMQRLYREVMAFPDRYSSWVHEALTLALSWSKDWRPDLVYSSAPPQAGNVAAVRIASRLGVPWVAELRDLWAGNPYDPRHHWIEPFYDSYAKKILSQARGCVAVTSAAIWNLQALTHRPVLLSYNGYDPDEFLGLDDLPPLDSERLTILHAGTIYPNKRDPSPLFEAINLLGPAIKNIRCLFFHDANNAVVALAAKFGISEAVEVHPQIPREEILKLERRCDLLLECRWSDTAGDGVIPGKIFEYIGARRPVLSIGSTTGEAAKIVRQHGIGLASNDPVEICEMLRSLLETKRSKGRIPDIEVSSADKFRRNVQFDRIERFVNRLLNS